MQADIYPKIECLELQNARILDSRASAATFGAAFAFASQLKAKRHYSDRGELCVRNGSFDLCAVDIVLERNNPHFCPCNIVGPHECAQAAEGCGHNAGIWAKTHYIANAVYQANDVEFSLPFTEKLLDAMNYIVVRRFPHREVRPTVAGILATGNDGDVSCMCDGDHGHFRFRTHMVSAFCDFCLKACHTSVCECGIDIC